MSESDRITKIYCSFFAVSEELKKGSSDQAKGKTRKKVFYGKCISIGGTMTKFGLIDLRACWEVF